MRALLLRDPGTTPTVTDVEEPAPGSGEVMDVVAAGLNPVDLLQAAGSRPEDLPRVVGNEAVVARATGFAYAERAEAPAGTLAERTRVRPETLIPLPSGVDPSAAVAVGIPGIAAWLSLTKVGELRRGESVLVLGATGAAGRIAVQAARLLGAGRVVAAGRRPDALRQLDDLGADATAVLGGDDDAGAIRTAANGPVDLVFDPLYGAPLVAALDALTPGGRSVTVGMSAGDTASVPFPLLFGQRLLSHSNMTASAADKAEAYRNLLNHLAAGRLVTETEDVALDDAETAWTRQQDGPDRKLVIRP